MMNENAHTQARRFRISIKHKIWIAIMSTVLVLIGVLWLLQVVFFEDYYLRQKSKEIVKSTNEIVDAIYNNGLYNSGEALINIGLKNTICIDVSDLDGRPLVQYEGLGDNCAVHTIVNVKPWIISSTLTSDSGRFSYEMNHPRYNTRYYTCGMIASDTSGTSYIVTATATLAPLQEAISIIRTQLIYVSLLLVVLSTVIAFFVARSMTKPIKKISNAAKQIANGKLDVDVEVKSRDEIGELSDSFKYMSKELAKVNVLQKELVANISHDIRTPLTMIRGYAETIKDLTGDNKATRERQLDIIIDETQHLTTLVNDVMDLSLMQAGQVRLNAEPFDIAKKSQDILKRFELLEHTKGFTFTLDLCGKQGYSVIGDSLRIEQVLYNLINNAINHIGDIKHITVKIYNTDALGSNGQPIVRIEVSDTGTGIKQEDLPLIWDRYYKPYKKDKKEMGTGLGLSIVKAVLINHNSNFGVSSVLGKGSTFWFTLNGYTE